MGRAIRRLNPKIQTRVNRRLKVLLTEFVWNLLLFLSFPSGDRERKTGKGRKPWDVRIVVCMCILRIGLKKTYDEYESEIRFCPVVMNIIGVNKLPSRAVVHRGMRYLTLPLIREIIWQTTKKYLPKFPDINLDSSGFSLLTRSPWFCIRTGQTVSRKDNLKVHVASCNKYQLIVNFAISKWSRHDSPFLIPLLKICRFLGLVRGDGGYASRKNFQFIEDKKGFPLISMPDDATSSSKRYPAWNRMFWLVKKLPTIIKAMMGRRSLAETVFSALKRKWNYSIQSKLYTNKVREAALRLLAYNLRQALYINHANKHNLQLWVRAKEYRI